MTNYLCLLHCQAKFAFESDILVVVCEQAVKFTESKRVIPPNFGTYLPPKNCQMNLYNVDDGVYEPRRHGRATPRRQHAVCRKSLALSHCHTTPLSSTLHSRFRVQQVDIVYLAWSSNLPYFVIHSHLQLSSWSSICLHLTTQIQFARQSILLVSQYCCIPMCFNSGNASFEHSLNFGRLFDFKVSILL